MGVWELNPEGFGSLWLMASGTWGGIILAEGLHDWGRQAVLLLNYTLASAYQLRKSTESLSQGSRVAVNQSLHRLGCHFRGKVDWPAEHQFSSVKGCKSVPLNENRQAYIIVHIIFLNNVTELKVNTEILKTVIVFYIFN
jgi:hypothetical protein